MNSINKLLALTTVTLMTSDVMASAVSDAFSSGLVDVKAMFTDGLTAIIPYGIAVLVFMAGIALVKGAKSLFH